MGKTALLDRIDLQRNVRPYTRIAAGYLRPLTSVGYQPRASHSPILVMQLLFG
jgi:hypothetical protein